jgi:hypothetical protein
MNCTWLTTSIHSKASSLIRLELYKQLSTWCQFALSVEYQMVGTELQVAWVAAVIRWSFQRDTWFQHPHTGRQAVIGYTKESHSVACISGYGQGSVQLLVSHTRGWSDARLHTIRYSKVCIYSIGLYQSHKEHPGWEKITYLWRWNTVSSNDISLIHMDNPGCEKITYLWRGIQFRPMTYRSCIWIIRAVRR